MIKFFRKIRQNLLSEGKTGKYLKYAIGEIVLVVFGILIALQINNWNESNKLRNEGVLYLQRLNIDLVADTLYFNQKISRAKLLIDQNTSFIKKMYDRQQTFEEKKELLYMPLWDSEYLTIQDNTFKELVSSGKLNIINNSTLKATIVNYYRLVESNEYAIKENNEYSRSIMGTYVSNYAGAVKQTRTPKELEQFDNVEMFREEDFEYVNNPSSHQFQSLEDIILVYIIKHKNFIRHFQELKSKSTDLIFQIKQELQDVE